MTVAALRMDELIHPVLLITDIPSLNHTSFLAEWLKDRNVVPISADRQ
jgi:hypothetical protein